MKWRKRESRLLAAIYKTDWLDETTQPAFCREANLFLSIFLVNLEIRSVITEGQFVFLDVLVENVTTCKDKPEYHWLADLQTGQCNCGSNGNYGIIRLLCIVFLLVWK